MKVNDRWSYGVLIFMQYISAAKALCIFVGFKIKHLLGNHACAGAMPSKRPAETALALAVGHLNGGPFMIFG